MSMKLKFLLWVAMSLTFTGVFMSCGDEDVMEQVKEEKEKEEIVVGQIIFSITSENTVEVAEYMDIHKYDVVIPSKVWINSKEYSVTGIADFVFYGRKDMTSIEIPSSVTSIGSGAFSYCKNADIVIDNSEENVTIGWDAFANCKSVTWKK